MQESKVQATCEILGTQGVIIQIVLAALSFSVLVFKRFKQQPKRPWKIWALDTSKQGLSQLLAHFINIGISLHLSEKLSNDPCMWYVAINVLDNSLGVFFSLKLLGFIERKLFSQEVMSKFKSGNYYQPIYEEVSIQIPQMNINRKVQQALEQCQTASNYSNKSAAIKTVQVTIFRQGVRICYKYWAIQLLLWNTIVTISKVFLFAFELVFNQPINVVTEITLGWWLRPYPVIQLVLVIILIPVLMNGLAFWIQDSFLMKNKQTLIKQKQTQRILTQTNSIGRSLIAT